MKRELRNKLQNACHALMAQSMIMENQANDNSIIYELEDLVNDPQIIATPHKPLSYNISQLQLNYSSPKITSKTFTKQNENSRIVQETQMYTQRKNLFKMKTQHNENQKHDEYLFKRLEKLNQRKGYHKQLPMLESKNENSYLLKLKYELNKSKIIKNKNIIYDNLLDRCENCNSLKSEIFQSSFVCSNQSCRFLHTNQKNLSFPLIGALLQAQSSTTPQQFEVLIKKIKKQIQEVEEWLSYLKQLSNEIQDIKKGKKQFQKHNKDAIKNLTIQLASIKSKKNFQSKSEYQKGKKILNTINFQSIYNELKKWHKINISKLEANKSIQQLMQHYRPLCLKKFINGLAEQMACISNNFSLSPLYLKASQQISYSFQGNLNELVLIIDNSMQLRRQNFLLIQNLECLKIIFQSRKTSRQLRQLFNILPHSKIGIIEFDYKLNSHVSSQSFPLLSKASEIASQQLNVNLSNARHEVLDDLMEASKLITVKHKINMSVTINSHIQENEWPTYTKSKQWGTKVIKNYLKNIGNKLCQFRMSLPIRVNVQQISQYILNSDYCQLNEFKLVTMEASYSKQNRLSALLHEIVNRRKALLYQLANQRKHKNHPLHLKPKLAESVYRVLF